MAIIGFLFLIFIELLLMRHGWACCKIGVMFQDKTPFFVGLIFMVLSAVAIAATCRFAPFTVTFGG